MQSITKLLSVAALAFASLSAAAQTVTINFDNAGDENGVTTPGTSEFEFMSSAWSGGVIATEGILSLYASGSYSYEVPEGPAMVVFDQPVTDVEFFYVHGSGFDQGTATAFDANGVELASVDSNQATTFADQANFVSFDTDELIMAVEFTAGVIDDFSYTLSDEFAADFRLFDGQWVNADDAFQGAGEGLTFDFIDFANILFVAWFTHTTMPEMPGDGPPMDVGDPGNRWLTAQLALMGGNTATGDLFANRGGEFDAPPTDFQDNVAVGSMTIEFTACNRATVSYSIDDPALSREFEIIPLVERLGSTEPVCEEHTSGGGDDGGGDDGGDGPSGPY